MQEILLKIRYFEIGLSKTLKKSQVYVFFRTQPLLMYKVIVNKRGLELVTSRSSVTKQVQKNLGIILPDKVYDVI